jgi:hypothetical protein
MMKQMLTRHEEVPTKVNLIANGGKANDFSFDASDVI